MPDDYGMVLDYLNALMGRVYSAGRDGARYQGEYSGFCRGYALRGPDLDPDYRNHTENVQKLQALNKRWGNSLDEPEPEPEPEPEAE